MADRLFPALLLGRYRPKLTVLLVLVVVVVVNEGGVDATKPGRVRYRGCDDDDDDDDGGGGVEAVLPTLLVVVVVVLVEAVPAVP